MSGVHFSHDFHQVRRVVIGAETLYTGDGVFSGGFSARTITLFPEGEGEPLKITVYSGTGARISATIEMGGDL